MSNANAASNNPETLREYFSAVACKADWKAAIDAVVPFRDLLNTIAAIEFFTATTPTVEGMAGGLARVRSVGYRMGPAGDH